MAKNVIKGRDMGLYVEKTPGSGTFTRIGCADNISLEVNTEELEVTCGDTGQFYDFEDGQIDWSISLDGPLRRATNDATTTPPETDATDNVTAENLLDYQLAGTALLVRFSLGTGAGAARYGGKVKITSNSISGAVKENGTFSGTLRGKGALTKTLAPA